VTISSADYAEVAAACRDAIAHGSQLPTDMVRKALLVVEHASQAISTAYAAGTPGTGVAADDLAAMIAATPNVSAVVSDAVLDG
jgi:hypothetical protein